MERNSDTRVCDVKIGNNMENKEKICNKCGKVYPATLEYFGVKLKGTFDLDAICKKCIKEYKAKYYQNNKEKIMRRSNLRYLRFSKQIKKCNKIYYYDTIEKQKKYRAEYRKNNKNKVEYKKYFAEYYKNNRDTLLKYQRKYQRENACRITLCRQQYRDNNREEIRRRRREQEKRYKLNMEYRILINLRIRLSKVIKYQGIKKSDCTMKLVGCTIKNLLKHIESQFDSRMTWDNYGKFGWHIDHIKPCISFDLAKPEEQKKCFHYTNLRPLWWLDNLKKSSFYKGKLYKKGEKLCQI